MAKKNSGLNFPDMLSEGESRGKLRTEVPDGTVQQGREPFQWGDAKPFPIGPGVGKSSGKK